jgi:hypothetical protein
VFLHHVIPRFPEFVLFLQRHVGQWFGLTLPERVCLVPGGHTGERLREVTDQTTIFQVPIVVVLPKWKNSVMRTRPTIADLGDEVPITDGQ